LFGASTLLTLEILFHGEDSASVTVTDLGISQFERAIFLPYYYARMMFTIGVEGQSLIGPIDEAARKVLPGSGVVSRPETLPHGFRLGEDASRPVAKRFVGTLQKKKNDAYIVQTKIAWGGEGYYSPMSVKVALQHMIRTLSDADLAFTAASLLGINWAYENVGSWTEMSSISGAPSYGVEWGVKHLIQNGYDGFLEKFS
jgi:hypothetical protein